MKTLLPKMTIIHGGKFANGIIGKYPDCISYNEHLNGFKIGIYPVTVAEFKSFLDETTTGQDDTHPVIGVNWYKAVAYTNWLRDKTGENYRLPTEVEWEYAARAGTATKYWWGDDFDIELVNYAGNWDYKRTSPVGSHKPNDFGLYDTSGNVWELCSGKKNSNNDPTTDVAPVRGGSWASKDIKELTNGFRKFSRCCSSLSDVGFRVVCEL